MYLTSFFTETNPVRVFVYRNLNQKCWSAKALEGEHKGRVIFHASFVVLLNTEFKVGDGRLKVRADKRKNVHAGAVGVLSSAAGVRPRYNLDDYKLISPPGSDNVMPTVDPALPEYHRVTYNPYTMDSFKYADTMEDVTRKNIQVVLDKKMKAYIYDPDGSVRASEAG